MKKIFITIFILLSYHTITNAQHNLVIKTYGANDAVNLVPFDGFTLDAIFDDVIEDGANIIDRYDCSKTVLDLPFDINDFNGVQVVLANYILSSTTYIDIVQADVLIQFVKNGGVLIASFESLRVKTSSGIFVDALKYIGEALLCNNVSISTKGAFLAPSGIPFHANEGLLKLNSNDANTIATTGSYVYMTGVPSENTIMVEQNITLCSNVKVLDMILPAYPKMGIACPNNNLNIQGFAILSGEVAGPLTAVSGDGSREKTQLNINYAQLIYDFYYDLAALQNRYAWSNDECNVNPNCPPNVPFGYQNIGIPQPEVFTGTPFVVNTCPATTIDLMSYVGTTPINMEIRWFTNNTHIGTPVLNAATSGTYYAFYYSLIHHCYSIASSPVVVEIRPCDPCSVNFAQANPTILTGLNGIISNTLFKDKLVWITSDITLDNNVDFNNSEVVITPNTKILVKNNASLNIIASHFYTCENKWQGIVLSPLSKININGSNTSPLTSKCSFIEDAQIAVQFDNNNYNLLGEPSDNIINIKNTIFNRNNVSIQIENFANESVVSLPFSIKNTLFTSRNILFTSTLNSWDNLQTVSNNYYNGYPATPNKYAEPYILNSDYHDEVLEAFLKEPISGGYTTDKPQAGIVINNVGGTSNSGVASIIKIGDGGADGKPDVTIFDNLNIGIDATNTNLIVNNCTFQKPNPDGITPNKDAIGIKIENTNENVVDISKPLGKPNNAFFDLKTAISCSGSKNVTISDCDIRSSQSSSDIDNDAVIRGRNGIVLNNFSFDKIAVLNNNICNIRNGIKLFSARDKVPFDPAHPNANIINLGDLDVSSNHIDKTLTSATPSGNEYVENGINLEAFLVSGIASGLPIHCSNNFITEAMNGIKISNWHTKNTLIETNTITLISHPDPTNTTYKGYGIHLEAGYGTTMNYDINNIATGSKADNIVFNNTVTGSGTGGNTTAIWLSQQNNTNVGCNNVYSAEHGFKFEGSNLLTKFWDNVMDVTNQNGLTLWDGGDIGKQGNEVVTVADPYICTSNNSWVVDKNTWNTNLQRMTYCYKSTPANSPFVIRDGYAEINPNGASYSPTMVAGSYYSNANGLIVITTPDDALCERLCVTPYSKKKHDKTLLEQIADGSILLPNDEADERLRTMQQQLYELVKANPKLAINSNNLQQFIYDNQWNSLDFIHYAGKYAAEDKMDIVELLLGFWPGQTELDDNYYKYFNWVVNMYKTPKWLPNADEVFEVANKCPVKNGVVVYAARNLFNAIIGKIYRFENNCDNAAARGTNTPTQFIRLKQPKVNTNEKLETSNVVIFPNPAKSIVNVTCNRIKQITVVDALGKTAIQKEGNGVNNMQLNIEQLQKGIYLIKVIDSHNKVSTTKFIKE
jgi:Secretion system C-terminal sorting domain